MKLVPRIALIILLLASGAALYLEHSAKTKAQEDLAHLRTQLDTAQTDLAKQDQQTKARETELNKLREATKDIYKLRNEAAQLQKEKQTAAQLRAENQQLRSTQTSSAVQPQSAHDDNSIAKENWAFAGYATPEAALQSVAWAMREGDPKTMLSAVTDDEKARMGKEWANKSEAEISADNNKGMSKITGFRILEKKIISDDEVVLSVYAEGKGDMTKFSIKRIGNEWKFGGRAHD